ncbi:MAG: hypothetical protein QOF91_2779 [Alphaproteobacteria bacterium]|nr:hypothetical protein [Alphaproteobacteria bacterium]
MVLFCFAALIVAIMKPGVAVAQSGPLTIVTVDAKDLLCIYDKSCKIATTDSSVAFDMQDTIGHLPQPRLHVRTVPGTAGAPAAGKTGYLYRLDLTNVVGALDVSCATAFQLDVGPTGKFEYFKNGANADVFVVDKGAPGTVGLAKAERIGSGVTFTFRKRICVGTGPGGGESSLFFGLTSDHPPKATTARVMLVGGVMAKRESTATAKAPTRAPAY